jgi:transketolase
MPLSSIELASITKKLRAEALRMITNAKNGHPGGSLSAMDIIAYLYFNEMKHDPKNPNHPNRDRFVLSKGHGVPALYAVLAECGYFSKDLLKTFRQTNTLLQGHPANRLLDGIEASTGSLGQGLSVALGMALAKRLDKSKDYNVYALLGDGEMQEGQVWEALMCAAHYKIDNLIVFVDRNNGQIDGLTDNVMSIQPLNKKCESFGWHTLTINGHDFDEIKAALQLAHKTKDQPTIIIANTVKGKGVSFLEKDTVAWHGKALSKEELELAFLELGE